MKHSGVQCASLGFLGGLSVNRFAILGKKQTKWLLIPIMLQKYDAKNDKLFRTGVETK